MKIKFILFKEIRNCITLSLAESKMKTLVDHQNVSENFSVEILSNLKLYEEHT
jgi:hypothetical protein